MFAKVGILSSSSVEVSNANKTGRADISKMEDKLTKERYALVKRLDSAHQNALESLPVFASGVAAAVATGVPTPLLNSVCLTYLGARVCYTIAYALPPVLNGMPRSACWGIATAAQLGLWVASAQRYM